MVSSSHEALHRIFQKDAGLLVRSLQRLLHIPFPEPREIKALDVDLTEIEPIERRCDSLLRVDTDDGNFLFVIESQGRKDEAKRGSWAYYLSYLYEKYHCEPVLIVVTQSAATARWAAKPIQFGLPGWPSLTVRPLVLGPENVPVIADRHVAERDVPLAVFSAITHGRGQGAAAILGALAEALKTIDPEAAGSFAQLTRSGLVDPRAKEIWEELMTVTKYFFDHPLAEQVRAEGRVEGREEGRVDDRAEMVLNNLVWRGLDVPPAVRERVTACTDLDQLTVWARRALQVSDATEVFSDDET
ncbi:hypothetical protein OG453_03095 [Streptomyces sp. NBC_01381]|uniref:hypothetical protein n=1 Tax=Streptomyces sp. NBC_01381 TaxID=2903845 RepID=UPI002255FA7A|nr:hypothetical protein [Streptomyces sp. NBC_01381]MCX4665668.1 hypothetical protein [Streptomyces sp. NBC_01381]